MTHAQRYALGAAVLLALGMALLAIVWFGPEFFDPKPPPVTVPDPDPIAHCRRTYNCNVTDMLIPIPLEGEKL
jgi:hypothetical protein